MADSISYTPTTWADGADGGTPITAARLNNIESGVTNATKQANANAEGIKSADDKASKATAVLGNGSISKMFIGSVESTVSESTTSTGREAMLFSYQDFAAKFGRTFDKTKDFVAAMNAEGSKANSYVSAVTYYQSGNLWVGVPGLSKGTSIRLNYLVILGE